MDKLLKPERLDVGPSSTQATAEFNHWFKTLHIIWMPYELPK